MLIYTHFPVLSFNWKQVPVVDAEFPPPANKKLAVPTAESLNSAVYSPTEPEAVPRTRLLDTATLPINECEAVPALILPVVSKFPDTETLVSKKALSLNSTKPENRTSSAAANVWSVVSAPNL